MRYRDLLPSFLSDDKEAESHPLSVLRRKIDSLFEDIDGDLLARPGTLSVRSNVSETDKELCITAEVPGVEQKDIDVSVSGNQITIKGEKKSESEEKKEEEGRQFHRVERSSGTFVRTTTVPFEIDADKVAAEFKNGVLTVTIPKPPEVVAKTKKVEIKSAA